MNGIDESRLSGFSLIHALHGAAVLSHNTIPAVLQAYPVGELGLQAMINILTVTIDLMKVRNAWLICHYPAGSRMNRLTPIAGALQIARWLRLSGNNEIQGNPIYLECHSDDVESQIERVRNLFFAPGVNSIEAALQNIQSLQAQLKRPN